MGSLIWLGIRAIIISLILTPIVRDIFRSYNVVDTPDAKRKIHSHPIPRIGGIAVLISYFGSFYWPGGIGAVHLSLVWTLLPAALVVFAVGLIDDLFGLKPWQKLLGELAAAGLAYWSGVHITSLAGQSTENWWSLPLTIVWLVACTNAFNLVDGLDGLAAGVGFFATLTIFTAAIAQQNIALAAATLPLAGCLFGFLCYNFNPATVFLGDGGSLLIGFLLGCYGVVWSHKSLTLLGMTAPLMALAIPLLDTLLAVVRRFLRHKPIFGADRGHIHHRLIDRGLTPGRAVLMVYGVCGIAAGLSLIQSFTRNLHVAFLVVLLFCCVAWIGIRYLQYSEFILAGRLVRSGEFQRALNAQIAIDGFARALDGTVSLDECWTVIRDQYVKFGLSGVHLHLNGVSYREGSTNPGAPGLWSVKIPLSARDYVEITREFQSSVMPMAIAPLADLLRDGLTRRLPKAGGGETRTASAAS